jgi:hypothetical protein
VTALPVATARGGVLARARAWHTAAGARIDGPVRWAIGLASAAAIAHAAVFGVAFAFGMWRADMPVAGQAVYAVFWMFVAGVAAGVQLVLTFAIALPVALLDWSRRGLAALAVGGLLWWIERATAVVWLMMAPAHDLGAGLLAGVALTAGALWGSWLPGVRSDRA